MRGRQLRIAKHISGLQEGEQGSDRPRAMYEGIVLTSQRGSHLRILHHHRSRSAVGRNFDASMYFLRHNGARRESIHI